MSDKQFLDWWKHYPRKEAREAAKRQFAKALKVATYAELIEAVKAYAAEVNQWPASKRQFIPHGRKWLYDHRWTDDRSEWNKQRFTAATAYALVCEVRRKCRQYTGHSGTTYPRHAIDGLPESVAEVAGNVWDKMTASSDAREVFYQAWKASQ